MNAIFGEYQKLANLKMVMDQRNADLEASLDAMCVGEVDDATSTEDAKPGVVAVVHDFWTGIVSSIGKHFQVSR